MSVCVDQKKRDLIVACHLYTTKERGEWTKLVLEEVSEGPGLGWRCKSWGLDEDGAHVRVLSNQVKRSLSPGVLDTIIGALGEEVLHRFYLAARRGRVKGGVAVPALGVQVCPVPFHQQVDHRGVPLVRRTMEGSSPSSIFSL